jgi:FAD/FMN-containing dehydrogenase
MGPPDARARPEPPRCGQPPGSLRCARERVRASYRDNYDRLAEVKAKYDPDNAFRVNQNIQPKAAV